MYKKAEDMKEEVKEETPIEEPIKEPKDDIREMVEILNSYELNEINKCIAIGKLIVRSAYEELKDNGLDNTITDPVLQSNIIKDVYQTREVTRREMLKAKIQAESKYGSGTVTKSEGQTQTKSLEDQILDHIAIKGYAYPDKIKGAVRCSEDELYNVLDKLIDKKKIWHKRDKGYYAIPKTNR